MQNAAADSGLKRALKARHLTMLSIGGVIGAGFFLGAGQAIHMAGPAVILSYLFGGIITVLVMVLLAEMAVAMPVAGSFESYARLSFGPLAGFLTGWTYWLAFLIGPASEAIAAGTFLNIWFPSVPVWVFCLVVAILLTMVNVIGVHFFGEVEFWLSLVKVVALVLFIVIGLYVLGFTPKPHANIVRDFSSGGFMPNGIAGMLGAMLIVIFSYGGTEAIGTAAEESANPERDIPKTLKGTILRIAILYVASITVLICVLPWEKAGISSSPYVEAFGILGGPVAMNIMNFVVLTAALSCIDTGVYATSRMLFSLSREGYFPKRFAKLHPTHKTPTNAILASSMMLFVGAIVNILSPNAYTILASISGFGFLFTWLMISLSQPRIRRIAEQQGTLKFRAPGAPYTQYLAVVLMLAILVGQLFVEGGWITLASGAGWLIFAAGYYLLVASKQKQAADDAAA